MDKVITLTANFMSREAEESENLFIETSNKPFSIEDFAPPKEQHNERTVLKEFIRNPKAKMVMARERKGDYEYISFQNFNINEKHTYWKAGQKVSIRLNEIEEVVYVLTQEKLKANDSPTSR